jgi:hypothetical protein
MMMSLEDISKGVKPNLNFFSIFFPFPFAAIWIGEIHAHETMKNSYCGSCNAVMGRCQSAWAYLISSSGFGSVAVSAMRG